MRPLAALAVVLLAGCGDGDGGVTSGQAVGGVVRNGVITLPVSIDGTDAQPFVVDTGSVLTRVDPSRYEALGLQPGLQQIKTLDVGSIHLTNVDVFAASLCNMMVCRGPEPSGLLGGTFLVAFQVTIDYRDSTVTFGSFTPPAAVGAAVTAPFAIEGGGDGMVAGAPVTLPATRVTLDVVMEGKPVKMVLDTGSTSIVLRPDVYDALIADGRAQSSVDIATVAGSLTVSTTTLHSVAVAGDAQTDVEAVRAPLSLDVLEAEVGHPVEGLLGGAFLKHYVTTIDFPARVLTLRPYFAEAVSAASSNP